MTQLEHYLDSLIKGFIVGIFKSFVNLLEPKIISPSDLLMEVPLDNILRDNTNLGTNFSGLEF